MENITLSNVKSISSLSAHGDQNDIVTWLKNFKNPPKKIFLNHGEDHQRDALKIKINQELNWDCEIPQMNSKYTF